MTWFANLVMAVAMLPIVSGAVTGDFVITAVGVATFAVGVLLYGIVEDADNVP